MKRKTLNKIGTGVFAVIFAILLVALLYGIGWIVTCGLIKLICMCFGWTFKWAIATGIYIVLVILKWVFGGSSGGNK